MDSKFQDVSSLRPRVLLVEDDPFLLDQLANLLSDRGMQVVCCPSIDLALNRFDEMHFDVLVTDLRMPDGLLLAPTSTKGGTESGLALARELRLRNADLRVVVVSGAQSKNAQLWCSINGGYFYLKGSFATDDFVLRIRNLAQASRRHRLDLIESILAKFPQFALRVSDRGSGRPSFALQNEYDAQELLAVFLRLFVSDVRREEPMLGTAGASARVDFLLRDFRVAIETKFVSKNLKVKQLGKQLIDDCARYRRLADCDVLVFLVCGDVRLITDHEVLKRDIESLSSNALWVVVRFAC